MYMYEKISRGLRWTQQKLNFYAHFRQQKKVCLLFRLMKRHGLTRDALKAPPQLSTAEILCCITVANSRRQGTSWASPTEEDVSVGIEDLYCNQ